MSRFRGRVKWFNSAEGYGFIGRDGQPDVFVHFTGIAKSGYKFLTEEDDVEFDIVQGPRGPQASEVTVLPMLLRESSSEGSV
ncbi:MAG TPA: cold shock domain-containing protein [Candidatus Angelobacter sp.]|nr:cold shock domain-containing protein [Candidatus Angelobacter sp.]